MSTHEIYSELRQPLVDGDKSPHAVTEDVCRPLEGRAGALWWVAFLAALQMVKIEHSSLFRALHQDKETDAGGGVQFWQQILIDAGVQRWSSI